jgi:hypothetical protein
LIKLLTALSGGWLGPALIAAALAGGGAWHFYSVHEARQEGDAAGAARVTALWDADRHRARELAERAAADYLQTERERAAAARKEIDDATTAATAARADSDRARRAAAGLRDAFAAAAPARGCAATGNPAAAASGPPADDRLRAEVLAELDDFAGAVAAEADERAIAGATCQRLYDSLRPQARTGASM